MLIELSDEERAYLRDCMPTDLESHFQIDLLNKLLKPSGVPAVLEFQGCTFALRHADRNGGLELCTVDKNSRTFSPGTVDGYEPEVKILTITQEGTIVLGKGIIPDLVPFLQLEGPDQEERVVIS
jgi:hypothetical protein